MSNAEIVEMMDLLIGLNEEDFQEAVDYVESTEMSQKTKEFLELELEIAKEKRQSAVA